MAVGLISNTILKPCSSSTDQLISSSISNTSTNIKVPLTIFDKAAFDLHVSVLYAFRPPMPSNEAMKEGLSKALIHFPHLAGRHSVDEQGRPCIHLNNAGVRIIETYVPTTLAEQLPFTPSTAMIHLFPPIEGVQELLQIQFNRYACGGLVIGQTAHHHVADGQSMSSFFIAWARLVRGLGIDVHPFHDRAAITVPRNPPIVEFDHRNIEFQKHNVPTIDTSAEKPSSSIENLVVSFSADFLSKLKLKVTNEISDRYQRYSTFECLLAHVWKKVTRARGLEPDECTQVRVAVNGRGRIKPPVPMEYFGNLVLWAYPKLRVQEVLHENHAYIAKAIHEAVARVDNKYFKSFIDFGETSKGDEEPLVATAPEIGNSLCPNIEVDSWLRFQFHDLDFGGGSPAAFLPPDLPVEGLMIFVPSFKEKGGVDVFMALLHEHVHLFKQVCHTFD